MKKPSFFVLFFLMSFPATNATLFTPALPSIVAFFQVPERASDWTIVAFLIGYAFGLLPYGPFANRFGRKKTLYFGLTLALVGNLLCAFAPSFSFLVFARFLQAVGASVGLKITYTMVGDLYDQTMATKIISRLGISFAIFPALAVAVGGYLTCSFGWRSCFYFLAGFSLVLLWAVSLLSETAKERDISALNLSEIASGYHSALRTNMLPTCGLIIGLGTAVIYLFNAKAPFLGIQRIGLSPEVFGTYSMFPLIGTFFGSFMADRLAGKMSLPILLFTGITISICGAVYMLFSFVLGTANSFSLFVPMFFIYMIDAVIFANIMSLGLSRAQSKAHGSAMINFVSLSTVVLVMFSTSSMTLLPELLMPLSFIVLLFAVLLLSFRLKRKEPEL